MKPTLKTPGTKRLKLICEHPHSNPAFKFNLRCCIMVRWLDAITGEHIAGGNVEVYAVAEGSGEVGELVASVAAAAAAGDASDAVGASAAGGASAADALAPADTRGTRHSLTSADSPAPDGSAFTIQCPAEDMPDRVMVRVTGPPCTGGENGGASGVDTELSEDAGASCDFYSEVSEEVHFSSDSDHTKFITAHLLRLTPGDNCLWVGSIRIMLATSSTTFRTLGS